MKAAIRHRLWSIVALCSLALLCALGAVPPAKAQDIPVPGGRLYRNVDYQFSVALPRGILACRSRHTNHGILVPLGPHPRCDGDYYKGPHISVFANYNSLGEANTPEGLAIIECHYDTPQRIEWLDHETLGGQQAAGCRQYFEGDRIEVTIVALPKIGRLNPEYPIEFTAYLETTSVRYESDMERFRKILRGVRIHLDESQL